MYKNKNKSINVEKQNSRNRKKVKSKTKISNLENQPRRKDESLIIEMLKRRNVES